MIFFGFLKITFVWNFYQEDCCAHSERYKNLMAGLVEVHSDVGNIAFPLLSVHTAVYLVGHFLSKHLFLVCS